MHGLVSELALQVYKTICNNIFKLGNYYIVREKLSNIFSYCVLANNVIHRTDAVHVRLLADVVSHDHPRW